MSHAPTKVLVVDDHPLLRDALREHLCQLDGKVEVLEAGNCADALALAQQQPDLDLVLLDLNLPDAHGMSALELLRERHPEIPVVVLSANDERSAVLEALDKGAMGFVPKTATTPVILSALRLVLAGGIYLPREVLREGELAESTSDAPVAELPARTSVRDLGLTGRQAQILALLLQGKPNKLISRDLGVAESTVKIHVTSILRALNVTNRVQAVLAAGRLGLRIDELAVAKKGHSAD